MGPKRRPIGAALALVTSVVVGCGGAGPVTTKAPDGASTAAPGGSGGPGGGAATTEPGTGDEGTAAPGGQSTATATGSTIVATFSSGPETGAYTGTADPGCSFGFFGTDVWGVTYMLDHLGARNELSYFDLVYGDGSADEMRPGVSVRSKIGFGPLGAPKEEGYRDYDIEVRVDGEPSTGSATVDVKDAGQTAVIHMTGATSDDDAFDITVTCPKVAGR